MRVHFLLGACLAVGCARPPNAPTRDEQPPVSAPMAATHAAVSPPPPPAHPVRDWSALREKLARESAAGYALFDRRAALAPSAADARAAKAPPSRPLPEYGAVRILADEKDVVRVTTDVRGVPNREIPFATIDGTFTVEGWLPKAALVPVLTRPLAKSFDDGTAYALQEGLPIALAERVRPLAAALADLPVEIEEGSLGLSFEVHDGERLRLPPIGGTSLGCQREGGRSSDDWRSPPAMERTRVAEEAVLQREAMERERDDSRATAGAAGSTERYVGPQLGMRGYFQAGCSLAEPVHVGGAALRGGATADPCTSTPVVRAADGKVYATFAVARAEIRGLTSELHLRAAGGCGSGRMGPRRHAILRVKAGATALYPDGTTAGSVRARSAGSPFITVTKKGEAGGMLCTSRSYATALLCFRPGDAVEEDGLAFDDER